MRIEKREALKPRINSYCCGILSLKQQYKIYKKNKKINTPNSVKISIYKL